MKVKVLKKFIDKHSGEIHKEGDLLTVSKDRFEEINKVADNLIEEIPEKTTVEGSTVKKKTPKKATKKDTE